MLCYLIASHCNPMAFNLRIPSIIVAFLRVHRWVVHYASMQLKHLLISSMADSGGLGATTPHSQET